MQRLRVRGDELARRCLAAGTVDTQAALARHLGISAATLSRVLAGKASPGPEFIARTLVAFPRTKDRPTRIDDLFEVVADQADDLAS